MNLFKVIFTTSVLISGIVAENSDSPNCTLNGGNGTKHHPARSHPFKGPGSWVGEGENRIQIPGNPIQRDRRQTHPWDSQELSEEDDQIRTEITNQVEKECYPIKYYKINQHVPEPYRCVAVYCDQDMETCNSQMWPDTFDVEKSFFTSALEHERAHKLNFTVKIVMDAPGCLTPTVITTGTAVTLEKRTNDSVCATTSCEQKKSLFFDFSFFNVHHYLYSARVDKSYITLTSITLQYKNDLEDQESQNLHITCYITEDKIVTTLAHENPSDKRFSVKTFENTIVYKIKPRTDVTNTWNEQFSKDYNKL